MSHTWENGSYLEEWVTLGKVGNTWINNSDQEK